MAWPTLLVEDHTVIRETLAQFFDEMDEIDVIGAVGSGPEALQFCDEHDVSLAIIDVSLPGMSGLELVLELRKRYPQMICLVLSGHQEITYIRRALANGAQGYVLKGEPEDLVKAIEKLLAGETYLSQPIQDKLAATGKQGVA